MSAWAHHAGLVSGPRLLFLGRGPSVLDVTPIGSIGVAVVELSLHQDAKYYILRAD